MVRVRHKKIGNALQGSLKQKIIAIDPAIDVSGRCGKTFRDGMALAIVWFANPMGDGTAILPNYVGRPVRAAAINYDVLEVEVALGNNRVDSLFQKAGLLKGRRNN